MARATDEPVRLVRLPSGDLVADNVPRAALQTLGALGGARWDPERSAWVVAAKWLPAVQGWARKRGRAVEITEGDP